MSYAEYTTVPATKTIEDLRDLLRKNNIFLFKARSLENLGEITFKREHISIKMDIKIPTLNHYRQIEKSEENARRAHLQQLRQKWRVLYLTVKSRLVAVEEGLEIFEQTFMPYIIVERSGDKLITAGQKYLPEIKRLAAG